MKLLFNGDSITSCYNVETNEDDMCGYAKILGHAFDIDYVNKAVAGATSSDLLNTVYGDVTPDYFILQIGANDAWNKIKNNIYVSSEQFYNNICSIIAEVKKLNSDVVVILQTIATTATAELLSEINRLNDVIRKISFESNYILIDNYDILNNSPFDNEELFFDDNIHYKYRSHFIIAKTIKGVLDEK